MNEWNECCAVLCCCYIQTYLFNTTTTTKQNKTKTKTKTETIWRRALECGEKLGAEVIVIDQSPVYDQLHKLVEREVKIEGNHFARGQLKSYMRTPVAFFTAQLISQTGLPCIVLGTGNRDEDGYLYYFCKAGDGVADVQLINDLHKSEVFKVGERLGVPDSILKAPPSADLWVGQTDEDELGFSYDFVELYTEYLNYSKEEQEKLLNELSDDALKQFRKLENMAVTIHKRNSHKEDYPYNINIL
jgi:NAD+ synthase (glutamine-hydrolysing)